MGNCFLPAYNNIYYRDDYVVISGKSELATVVGLSTEGYKIASSLIKSGIETIIVDENLQMGMILTQEIISTYKEVSNLLEGEALVSLIPMQSAINKADYIFFTPKIRKTDHEAKTEISTRFRDISKNISKNTIIIFCLPVGFTENISNIFELENISGLKEGEEIEYIYAPLQPRTTNALSLGPNKIGSNAQLLLKKADIKLPKSSNFETAEILFFRNILSKYISTTLDLELYKKTPIREDRIKVKNLIGKKESEYLDKITENLFDLKIVLGTLDNGDPSLYITTGVLRSIEGYVKYIVDEIRNIMKERSLKASKTKITLAWSIDKFEMRGERLATLNNVVDRLHDYIGDVNILSQGEYSTQTGRGFTMNMPDMNKTDIVVICSEIDLKFASNIFSFEDKESNTVILKADLLVDHIK